MNSFETGFNQVNYPISEGVMHGPFDNSYGDSANPLRHIVNDQEEAIYQAFNWGDIEEYQRDWLLENLEPWVRESISKEIELEEEHDRYYGPDSLTQDDIDEAMERARGADYGYYEGPEPVDVRTLEINDGPNGEAVDGFGNYLD